MKLRAMAGCARVSGMGDRPTRGADVHRVREHRTHQRAASTLVALYSVRKSEVTRPERAEWTSVKRSSSEARVPLFALSLLRHRLAHSLRAHAPTDSLRLCYGFRSISKTLKNERDAQLSAPPADHPALPLRSRATASIMASRVRLRMEILLAAGLQIELCSEVSLQCLIRRNRSAEQ
jgi:hypothetical protein